MDNSISEIEPVKREISRRDYKRMARIVIWLTLAILVVSVVLIVRTQICIGKTGIGQLGSAIGGVTAPIVGIGGAILVYLSFLIQHQANEDLGKRQKKIESKIEKKDNYAFLQGLVEIIIQKETTYIKIFEPCSRNEVSRLKIDCISRELLDVYYNKPEESQALMINLLVSVEHKISVLNYISLWLESYYNLNLSDNDKRKLRFQFFELAQASGMRYKIRSLAKTFEIILENEDEELFPEGYKERAKLSGAFYMKLNRMLERFFDE